jgi:hypothetical protein
MRELTRPLRISAVAVTDMRVEQMGVSPGIKGRFGLLDDRGTVMSFALCHKYSERTYKILDALYESMELDLLDIISQPEGPGEDAEFQGHRGNPEDDDEGLTFG